MNPISNNSSSPNDPPKGMWPLDVIKQKVIRFKKHETVYEIAKGIFLGGWTTIMLNPGLYALNMSMIGNKIVWKHCMRGVLLNGATVVPQTMLQVSLFKQMKKWVSSEENGGKDLALPQKIFCSMFAGGTSGVLTSSLEMILLQYQKELGKTPREIFQTAYSLGGIPRLNIGAMGLWGREMIWAPTYLVVTPAISKVYAVMISNEMIRDFAGAATAGAIAGFLTHGPNFLRAQKQKEALTSGNPRSYIQIFMEVGWKGLYNAKDVKIRMLVVAFACVFMTAGGRVVSHIEKKIEE